MVGLKLPGGGRQNLPKRRFMDVMKKKVTVFGMKMERAGMDG